MVRIERLHHVSTQAGTPSGTCSARLQPSSLFSVAVTPEITQSLITRPSNITNLIQSREAPASRTQLTIG